MGGDPQASRRKHTQTVYDVLRNAGYTELYGEDMSGVVMFKSDKLGRF